MLPILSELVLPTNNKNTNVDTITAVSQKPPTTSEEQTLPIMVPHRQMKPIKLIMATPLTSTEPLSLELFNRAAVDLDRKGEIEIEHYKKYLSRRD